MTENRWSDVASWIRHRVAVPDEVFIQAFIPDKEIVHKDCGDEIISVTVISNMHPTLMDFIKHNVYEQTINLGESPNIIISGISKYDDFTYIQWMFVLLSKEMYYDLYISSNAWRFFKNSILKERGFKCELCASRKNLHLHHLTYERLGKEEKEDVMILCQNCHSKAHDKTN